MGAAASAAAVAVVTIVQPPLRLWPSADEWTADERTSTGEQRTFAMTAQAMVTLNTQTSIRRRRTGPAITGIELITGEAAVDLSDDSPSFSVAAGPGTSQSKGGRFEVRRLDGKVCVTCVEGFVRIEHVAGSRTLQARQRTVYDATTLAGIASVDTRDLSAWRKGELVFDQTPLRQVIDEINRYRRGRVLLMSAAAGDRPVVGRFPMARLDEALLQLQRAFGLQARSLPGGLLVLS